MQSLHPTLHTRIPSIAAAALALALMLPPQPAAAAAPPQTGSYSMCGDIVQGVTCPKLFLDTNGRLWVLDTYGPFNVGDNVLVRGTEVPGCISICQQGDGCITGNTITSCLPDPTVPYCFCTSATVCGNGYATGGCGNSTGLGAVLAGAGSVSISADDLILEVDQLPPSIVGIFFMGGAQAQLPFGAGELCVTSGGAGIFRFPAKNSGLSGSFQEGPMVGVAGSLFVPNPLVAGSTWHFQGWYRDPAGGGEAFNLTDGQTLQFGP